MSHHVTLFPLYSTFSLSLPPTICPFPARSRHPSITASGQAVVRREFEKWWSAYSLAGLASYRSQHQARPLSGENLRSGGQRTAWQVNRTRFPGKPPRYTNNFGKTA
ncbi:hypothetical protein ElyMa_005779300 [Elysia marginata]|uniref:Secreted protein n=1 Tax=Elysia marginata TaxID=1093978 RepID=A0AAV4FQ09_9GAST|nr:hypothetical protein ElyMa_005779300 [Elysia marginata]